MPRVASRRDDGILRVAMEMANPYRAIGPVLSGLLQEYRGDRIVDLASGGGGPWPSLLPLVRREAGANVRVTLTDLHPNLSAVSQLEAIEGLTYHREPVSAFDEIPLSLPGIRTIFTGLHHLDPAEVRGS